MSKKKKEEIKAEIVEQEAIEMPQEAEKAEPVYLRETLFQFDEIKQYGLNQYFLRAILKDKYYTLPEAHRLIKAAL